MNSSANYDFVLKKRGFPRAGRSKHVSSSTLPRMKQKGLKIAKGIFWILKALPWRCGGQLDVSLRLWCHQFCLWCHFLSTVGWKQKRVESSVFCVCPPRSWWCDDLSDHMTYRTDCAWQNVTGWCFHHFHWVICCGCIALRLSISTVHSVKAHYVNNIRCPDKCLHVLWLTEETQKHKMSKCWKVKVTHKTWLIFTLWSFLHGIVYACVRECAFTCRVLWQQGQRSVRWRQHCPSRSDRYIWCHLFFTDALVLYVLL